MRSVRHLPVVRLASSLLASVALATAAEPTPAAARQTETPGAAHPGLDMKFSAARNGAEVLLSWEMPRIDTEIRQLEIMRHTARAQKGRSRVATVRVQPGMYINHVPEPTGAYWYWLKLTLADGRVIGAGPIRAPAPDVWLPNE